MNKAFFLDRDGIVLSMVYDLESSTIDTPRISSQIKFIDGVFDLLKYTSFLGYRNIVISNQPAVALKKMSLKNFNEIQRVMNQRLNQNHAVIDDYFYCFHHPFAKVPKYRINCSCRKPKTGLIKRAAKKYDFDLPKSWFLGDGVNDILAGQKSGCKTILLANTGFSEFFRILEEKLDGVKPDYIVKRLSEVKKILCK
ncbi:hypothetical protein A2960_03225 [Candidatus Gottesmanbacteria bacterium RIFCSPLOWO2_01_FULL_39_12b]|uniref:D,D-heptose 1,7-bisphosphate phosphatase n=1 Tax=Candidatus Gottesmanbacteria bacterium RIFCSPLOWO2_01_FULL_39_12b TaxID=1798388 RepID=A0A1F6AR80_9BACT|nr:MAG: hypothetical protein A2960_03225 [Candidatus Gottesmanbacteria bacterium RIFCSPLOWO2_01_FULL_39_12b]